MRVPVWRCLRLRLPLAMCAIVGAVAAGTLDHGFHFDDEQTIVDNPHIRPPVAWRQLLTDPAAFSRNPGSGMFRPLVLVTYVANYSWSGLEGWSWHLVNAALHLAAMLLVIAAAAALGATPSEAAVAGALFGLHPLAAEPVNYISSRSESLAAVFVLATFLLYVRSRRPGAGAGSAAMALAAFAAGLTCKATAVAAPLLIAAYEVLVRADGWRRWARRLVPFGLVLIAYAALVRGLVAEAVLEAPVRGATAQLATQTKALAYYLKLLAMPHPLSVEHAFRVSPTWGEAVVLLSLVLVLTLGGLAIRAGRAWRPAPFLLAWQGLVLLPTLAVPLTVLVNERRLYPAMAAACPLVVLLARGLDGRRLAGIAAAAALAALSLQRHEVWASERSLWEDAAAKAPSAVRPQVRLAVLDRQQGDPVSAERHLRRALELDPRHGPALNNLGNVYRQGGDLDSAAALYAQALEVLPRYPEALANLAAVRADQGRFDEAAELYERALRVQADRHEIHNNAGTLYLRLGRFEAAEAHLRRALRLRPGQAPALFNLSGALEGQGRRQEALEALEAAIAADPAYAPAHLHAGNVLLGLGRTGEARAAYRAFLERWRGDEEVARQVRDRLAQLTAEEGR